MSGLYAIITLAVIYFSSGRELPGRLIIITTFILVTAFGLAAMQIYPVLFLVLGPLFALGYGGLLFDYNLFSTGKTGGDNITGDPGEGSSRDTNIGGRNNTGTNPDTSNSRGNNPDRSVGATTSGEAVADPNSPVIDSDRAITARYGDDIASIIDYFEKKQSIT